MCTNTALPGRIWGWQREKGIRYTGPVRDGGRDERAAGSGIRVKQEPKPGVVVHICNPSILEAESGGVQGWSGIPTEMRCCL